MRTPRLTRQLIASSVLAASLVAAPTVALAASHSGTDSRDYPDRIFADDSFWYRQLPDDTPVAANSSAIVDHLYDQAEAHWGAPGEPNIGINTSHYTPPIYVARNSDPKVTFGWNNCQRKTRGDAGLIAEHLTGPDAEVDPTEHGPAGRGSGEARSDDRRRVPGRRPVGQVHLAGERFALDVKGGQPGVQPPGQPPGVPAQQLQRNAARKLNPEQQHPEKDDYAALNDH